MLSAPGKGRLQKYLSTPDEKVEGPDKKIKLTSTCKPEQGLSYPESVSALSAVPGLGGYLTIVFFEWVMVFGTERAHWLLNSHLKSLSAPFPRRTEAQVLSSLL